jgi:phospholipid transport system substrate-binding protein
MRTIKQVTTVVCCLMCFLWMAGQVEGASSQPTDQVRDSINSILEVLKNGELKQPANKEERRKRIMALISDRFDFEEMAKRSLARYWAERTPEQRKNFVDIFSELLQASYIGRIEGYSNETILYPKEDVRGDYGAVYTVIKKENMEIPVTYKVKLKEGKWWVYDVDIEGVSLVNTYRNQFAKIISQKSYEGLIKRMEKKLVEVRALEGAPASGAPGSTAPPSL